MSKTQSISNNPFEQYVDKTHLAEILGVSPRTIDRWRVRRLGVPRVKVGRRVLYYVPAVHEWLQSRTETA